MIKTQWTIETDQITLFPNRRYIFAGIIVLILVIVLGIYAKAELLNNTRTLINYLLIFGLAALAPFGLALNKIAFDMIDKTMLVKLFGFITIKRIDFKEIAAISPVTLDTGSYSYQVFKKSDRHGKGIRISSHYSKTNDKNAEALVNEVFPILERHLSDQAVPEVVTPVTSFDHYVVEDGVYMVKGIKGAKIFMGLLGGGFVVLGLYLIVTIGNSGNVIGTYATFVLGLFLLLGITKTVSLNVNNRTVVKSLFLGLKKTEYSFDDFQEFHVLRKTTNFVYSGTEVGLVMKERNSDKFFVVGLVSFRNTKKIERFMAETAKILGV